MAPPRALAAPSAPPTGPHPRGTHASSSAPPQPPRARRCAAKTPPTHTLYGHEEPPHTTAHTHHTTPSDIPLHRQHPPTHHTNPTPERPSHPHLEDQAPPHNPLQSGREGSRTLLEIHSPSRTITPTPTLTLAYTLPTPATNNNNTINHIPINTKYKSPTYTLPTHTPPTTPHTPNPPIADLLITFAILPMCLYLGSGAFHCPSQTTNNREKTDATPQHKRQQSRAIILPKQRFLVPLL